MRILKSLASVSFAAFAAWLLSGCMGTVEGTERDALDVNGKLVVEPAYQGAFIALAQWAGISPLAPFAASSSDAQACMGPGVTGVCTANYEYLTGIIGVPTISGTTVTPAGQWPAVALMQGANSLTFAALKSATVGAANGAPGVYPTSCSGAPVFRGEDKAPATETLTGVTGAIKGQFGWCQGTTRVFKDASGMHALKSRADGGEDTVTLPLGCSTDPTADACIARFVAGGSTRIGITSRGAIGAQSTHAATVGGFSPLDSSYPVLQPLEVARLTTHGTDTTQDALIAALANPAGFAVFTSQLHTDGAQ